MARGAMVKAMARDTWPGKRLRSGQWLGPGKGLRSGQGVGPRKGLKTGARDWSRHGPWQVDRIRAWKTRARVTHVCTDSLYDLHIMLIILKSEQYVTCTSIGMSWSNDTFLPINTLQFWKLVTIKTITCTFSFLSLCLSL